MNRDEMEYEIRLQREHDGDHDEYEDQVGHVGERFTPYEPACYGNDTRDYWDD